MANIYQYNFIGWKHPGADDLCPRDALCPVQQKKFIAGIDRVVSMEQERNNKVRMVVLNNFCIELDE